jgi:hypothetical protein
MRLWSELLRHFGIQPGRSPVPVEDRDPGLRLVADAQARIRQEFEDRRRAQFIEDQEALWDQERDLRRWDAS